jgi:hypothetical protein
VNIYTRKQRWKLGLAAAACAIVFASFWYSNNLVRKLSDDEKMKARFWVQAVQKRAQLIRFSNQLFNEIKTEERKKAELYAEAFRLLSRANGATDINFVLKVLQENTTVPVILLNDNGEMVSRNLSPERSKDTAYLRQELKIMKAKYDPVVINYYKNFNSYLYYKDSKVFSDIQVVFDNLINSFKEMAVNTAEVKVIFTDSTKTKVLGKSDKIDSSSVSDPVKLQQTLTALEAENMPIAVELGDGEKNFIFYAESELLTILKFYPYVQFGVIGLFLLIAYILFSTARKAEQDQVWVGMSKETAHQLGTPLSSLMAWNDHLQSTGADEEIVREMQNDLRRLQTITERFSKIGSQPALSHENICTVIGSVVDYLRKRTSRNVNLHLQLPSEPVFASLSAPLFEWVIENICKNAIDAMEGKGSITVSLRQAADRLTIDITDTGKGIPKSKFKTVFEPGFTTRSRGWGLGLSLSKRIIETYHKGKIFVLKSEPGKGSTFRIELPAATS